MGAKFKITTTSWTATIRWFTSLPVSSWLRTSPRDSTVNLPIHFLPFSNYLSGLVEGGLHDTRFYKCGPNTWSRPRKSAWRLEVRIDVSGDESTKVIADDVFCLSQKAVRGLHSVIRKRWTNSLTRALHQGRVARGLLLNSCTSPALSQQSLSNWPPSRSCALGNSQDHFCGRPWGDCEQGLPWIHPQAGHRHLLANPPIIIDLTITFDASESLDADHAKKIEKYSCLRLTLPFVVGALGSWQPSNNVVATALSIPPAPWRRLWRSVDWWPSRDQSTSSIAKSAATWINRMPLPWLLKHTPANTKQVLY